VVGIQMARSADSIGANIAESYGRFNFGEKLQFLYYSRGSIFETKYWLNRTRVRGLIEPNVVEGYEKQLTELARQLNSFASSLRSVRSGQKTKPSAVREEQAEYLTVSEEILTPLFSDEDLNRLKT
jgi:four helix bundle protein